MPRVVRQLEPAEALQEEDEEVYVRQYAVDERNTGMSSLILMIIFLDMFCHLSCLVVWRFLQPDLGWGWDLCRDVRQEIGILCGGRREIN